MKYRVVRECDGRPIVEEFEGESLLPAMEVRGFVAAGSNGNLRQRAELIGQPVFHGLLGPMWDGDAVRYEDEETYKHLST